MFGIYEVIGLQRKIPLALSFVTANSAATHARTLFDGEIACFAWDDEHPGCADFITHDGRLFTIEPSEQQAA